MPMTRSEALRRGRDGFASRTWEDAYAGLAAADAQGALEPDDLERLATAAYLGGREAECAEVWARAHQERLDRGERERAARCAFWLAFALMDRGERARAGGWLARASRLLDEAGGDCVERGYLLFPVALEAVGRGDNERARETFQEAAAIGERFGDRDLVTLGRHGVGRALLRMGDVDRGVALLDEAMAAVEAGEVSPTVAGHVYCSVIEGCLEVFDLRRAQEWTTALTQWCAEQPDLVPYRGQCLVRRAELLRLHGDWTEAMEEARRAGEWLARPPPQRALGAAYYQQAELYRLRGAAEEAEEAYRQASAWGRKPQPGLALLRLAQGRTSAAVSAIRRALDEARAAVGRCVLLPACVEVMLAGGEIEEAHAAAEELSALAGRMDAPLLHAMAEEARGAVLLARGEAREALPPLRRAWTRWHEMAAPYEAARVRVLVGRACALLGDRDTAELELGAARSAFEQLGAVPDAERAAYGRARGRTNAGPLTPRELQVLRLVATGQTNRAIAAELFISERTVDRHVSNLLTKLGVPSRAAATAWAYEHDLV